MVYFENNRLVNFEDLKQVVNEDGKRIYSEKLLQQMESGNFNYLNESNLSDRNNEYFMEPLLYAVRNSEFATYEVYKYYGEELQKKDLAIATEIAINEPKIIEGTAISNNDTIMLYLVEINPKVIIYISDELKNDGDFIENLCKTGNREAVEYVIEECNIATVLQDNPDLANNAIFMGAAIKEDATLLARASEELKNDYEFIKEAAKGNKEVIDYVAEHTEEFGKEAITGAKEVLTENTTCRAIDEFQAELEKVQEEKARMESQEGFDKDSEEYKKIKIRERQLNNNMAFMDKIRNTEDPRRALKLIDILCEGKSEEYKQDLIKYFKLDDAVISKEKEEKAKETKIEPEAVEKAADGAKLSDVQGETNAIRDVMTEKRLAPEENRGEIGE